MLSAAANGQFFLVCENVANHLTAYETQTGKRLWRLDGGFQSATVSRDGVIYALTSAGTIYGDEAVVINQRGEIERKAKVGGFDLVVDDERKVFVDGGCKHQKMRPGVERFVGRDPAPLVRGLRGPESGWQHLGGRTGTPQ